MWKMELRICNRCDGLSIDDVERLLSFALGIENISSCTSCGKENSRIVMIIILPLQS